MGFCYLFIIIGDAFLQILGKQYFEFSIFLPVDREEDMTLYRGGKSLRKETENQCSLIVKGPPSIYFGLRIIHWDTFFFQLIIVCSANTVLGTAVSDVFRQRSMWHDSHLLHLTLRWAEVLSNFTHQVASSRVQEMMCFIKSSQEI